MYVFLGNHKAVDADTGLAVKGKQRVEIRAHQDRDDVAEVFADITRPGGIWAKHAKDGSKPAWVASDNPRLARLLGDIFDCEIRKPLPDGERGEHAGGAFAIDLKVATTMARNRAKHGDTTMLRTSAGTDFVCRVLGNATSAPATYMALTAATGPPASGDTSLSGEITTSGGGLIRKAATFAHTTGTTSFTQTVTFTANSSDSLPVTVNMIALFTASSGGTMVFEIDATAATFNASGDACTYTYTITP